jgi:hypothetical protein
VGLGGWISETRRQYGGAFPRCSGAGCASSDRLWRRLCRGQAGTRLHGAWYCSPQCLERAVRERFAHAAQPVLPAPPAQHRIPLGLLLLARGQVSNHQLRVALEAQRSGGRGLIGHWLQELGFATEPQVTAALGLQWACPVLPAFAALDSRCTGMLPFRLLEKFRMLPVQFVASSSTLYIAFSQGVDYAALYAIEQMLGCRTEACLIGHSTMDQVLERIGHERRPGEMLFEGWRDVAEMARITCSYALKLGAQEVRDAACGEYVWVRLESAQSLTDLLFRRPVLVRVQNQAQAQAQGGDVPGRAFPEPTAG